MKNILNRLLPFLGIRGKLLVAFVGLALVPLGVLTTYNIRATADALTVTNADHLRLQLLSNIGHVESYVAFLDANARMLARWIEESELLDADEMSTEGRAKIERFFYLFARMRPDYYQIRLLSDRGREQVRINRYGERLDIVSPQGLQEKSNRYYFEEAMSSPDDQTYFSRLDLNVEQDQVERPPQLVFRVAHKARDREAHTRGVVIINVFAREILDRIKILRPDPRGDVLFVGGEGQYVREDCTDGNCRYVFGHVQERLAAFGPRIIESILSGATGVMVPGPQGFVSYGPVQLKGTTSETSWRVAIVYPRDLVLGPVQQMRRLSYGFAATVACIALLLAGLATRTLTMPIQAILRFVQGVAVGDFRQDLVVETRDEIEQLADGVRHSAKALAEAQGRLVRWNEELQVEVTRKVSEIESLLETKHAMELQLRQADRLSSLGMLSASLAHEVGNPLAAIKTAIQLQLRDESVPQSTRETLEIVLTEIDRLAQVLERITGFVRPSSERPVSLALSEVFRRITFLLEREARRKGVLLRLEGDAAELPVVAGAQRLEQIVLNLLVNALQAMAGPGVITVAVQSRKGGIELSVADTGPGIPEELRSRVFEPFFTTKPGGTGLGLAIVRQLVSEMGGKIRLEFPATGGTLARIELAIEATGQYRSATGTLS